MMIVIRVAVPRSLAKKIKIKDVIAVSEDGTQYKLEVLNAYFDTRDQPSVKLAKHRLSR